LTKALLLACYGGGGKVASVRIILVFLAAMSLAQCASRGGEDAFRAGQSDRAYVIIGVAEAADMRDPVFAMLWRRLDDEGRFTEYDDSRAIEARTNSGQSVRVRGIPGEFAMGEVRPGIYALDSVFAALREQSVSYFAQGVVIGPERPAFEVRAGEAIYLGIWQLSIDGASAKTQLWRLDEADMRAVLEQSDAAVGDVQLRATALRAVPCTPRQLNNMSQRQIC
jgi:hypothetical protein